MSDGRNLYPSLSNLEKEGSKFNYIDDCNGSVLDVPEDFLDEEYNSSEDHSNALQQTIPEVNLKNVLSGILLIVTGQNKDTNISIPSSNASFIGSANNGDTFLNSSVYIPSAPPLLEPTGIIYAYKEVLEPNPSKWLPDGSSTVCMPCNDPFTALTRGRRHCRFCGGIFCRGCSKGRERNPQRVCDACYDRLDLLQGVLINTISNAVQVAKHDVADWTCRRGWLNLSIGLSMEHEIYKSSNTLRSYCQVARLNPERSIPAAVLKGAKGLAFLTVAKARIVVSYKLGTGLVVARWSDGSWSAPSAIFSVGSGWGAQGLEEERRKEKMRD
ncbi:hypothetical protein LguiB_011972 [Lonicera macranthoides]